MTMGEGGAVVTRDFNLKRILESFRDWGRDCWCPPGHDNTCKHRYDWKFGKLPKGYDHKYVYSHLGYNLKITDMQAAVGLAQLERMQGFSEARTRNFEALKCGLSEFTDRIILPACHPPEHSFLVRFSHHYQAALRSLSGNDSASVECKARGHSASVCR